MVLSVQCWFHQYSNGPISTALVPHSALSTMPKSGEAAPLPAGPVPILVIVVVVLTPVVLTASADHHSAAQHNTERHSTSTPELSVGGRDGMRAELGQRRRILRPPFPYSHKHTGRTRAYAYTDKA